MAGRLEELLNDKDWSEVKVINSYAVLMGYLSMAIKGLGFLVLTWTTVVLLGGFVSSLHKKDFWCLTFITLVQMAGVFDVVMNEKLRYLGHSPMGIVAFMDIEVVEGPSLADIAKLFLRICWVLVQLVILATLLFPLAIIYMFGILMSGGISLWRLIEHDYSDGEASNLTPAMDTLYCLALIQCAVFCYRFMLARSGERLAKNVAGKSDPADMEILLAYLRATRTGCEKDPSFSNRRNLVTYAVDMIGSRSPADRVSGVSILYTSMYIEERKLKKLNEKKGSKSYREQRDIVDGQRTLVKHLLLSRGILQTLLEALDSKGPHDKDSRIKAATIVERIAFCIKLEQFPGGIQHISSLIGTLEEYRIAEPYQRDCLFDEYEQNWVLHARCLPPSDRELYKQLLEGGLSILRKLAFDENNCRVMSDTRDLVSKIMAPVTCDLLHHTTNDHGAWSDVVCASLKVMAKLANAPGETGAKLRREISSCEEAISTLWRILSCNKCNEDMQQGAIYVLTRLHMYSGTEGNMSSDCSSSREDYVRKLVDILTDDNQSMSKREYVGAELWVVCFDGGISYATTIIQNSGDVADSLTKLLVRKESVECRIAAANILKHLCAHYTKDDEYRAKLKKAVTTALPEVIEEILGCGDKTHTGGEGAHQDGFAQPNTDIEKQHDNVPPFPFNPKDDEQDEQKVLQALKVSISSHRLLSSLLSLSGTVYDRYISELGPDLAAQFHASRFLNKLKEISEKRSDHATEENLELCKAIAKMVTSMLKHSSGLVKREDLQGLIVALSSASNNMMDLDYSMVFISGKHDRRTLASLVNEAAQELHAMLPSTSVSG